MPRSASRNLRIAVLCAVVYLLGFGVAEAFFPIRPFWNDEWRLLYNIKFKTFAGLWGRLDLLQECPRVYLTLLKAIAATFDYSYTSLRLPPLMLTVVNVLLLFRLHKLLYPKRKVLSYLFILILLSSQTFTDYMVQVKHYEMDLLLCLLTLWQLFSLLKMVRTGEVHRGRYALLCLTAAAVPYLSYIYPITLAPVVPVVALAWWQQGRTEVNGKSRAFLAALPLLLAAVSIGIFYRIDVRQMLANKDMYASYQAAFYHSHQETFAEDFWKLFALVGSGELFEIVFGTLGITAFCYGIYRLAKTKLRNLTTLQYFHLYAVLLLIGVLLLFVSGKLMGGVARLTAYTVPSIAVLLIGLLQDLRRKIKGNISWGTALAGVLFLALFGNILTTCINTFTYPEYPEYIRAYRNTGKALRQAREEGIPFLVSRGIDGRHYPEQPPAPGQISTNTIDSLQIKGVGGLSAEILAKVHPEYKLWKPVPYFYMPDAVWTDSYVHQVPPPYKKVIAGDGINYRKYSTGH